jgi:hypothetical protein
MLTAFIDRHQTAKMVLLQTTYMHLEVESGLFKVDYKDKASYQLKLGAQGALAHYTSHPLLLPHNEARTTLYLNSRPENPQALLEDIERAIDSVFDGWYDWRSLFFGAGNYKASAVALARQNIAQKTGILLDYAPASIIKAVAAACEKHGVATKYFGSLDVVPSPRGTFSILFVGACYVIARDFRINALPITKRV